MAHAARVSADSPSSPKRSAAAFAIAAYGIRSAKRPAFDTAMPSSIAMDARMPGSSPASGSARSSSSMPRA
jgi:hypothetical protein